MNSADSFKPHPLALAVAIAVGALPTAGWAAAAGRVQFAFGQVSVQDAGGAKNAIAKGHEVNAGDTIVTDLGRAQIRFSDGSLVSLQPKSSFKIDDYNYSGNADGSERSFFSLFRGGLRTITGVIGHRNRDSYRVTTPVATIGIRGTEYIIQLDDSGAIVTVGDGAIAIINESGEVELVNGQTGHIISKDKPVQITEKKPVLPPPPPPKDARYDPSANEPLQDESRDLLVNVDHDNGDPNQTLSSLLLNGLPKLESGPGFLVSYAYFSHTEGGFHVIDFDANANAVFNGGQLIAWDVGAPNQSPRQSDIGQLSLVEAGSDHFIGWSRWSNPTSSEGTSFKVSGNNEQFFNENESVHMVTGKPTDLTALAELGETKADYRVLGFTSPTDRFGGALGHVNDKDANTFLSLNITAATVSGGASVTMPSSFVNTSNVQVANNVQLFNSSPSSSQSFVLRFTDLSVTANGFHGATASSSLSNTSINGTNGHVTVTGSGCSSSCDGFVNGLIAGPRAERGGFVYHMDGDASNIFGAITFIKNK